MPQTRVPGGGGVKDIRAGARTETSSVWLRVRDRSRRTESALWPEAPCPLPRPSKAPPDRLHVHTAPLGRIPGTLDDRKPDPGQKRESGSTGPPTSGREERPAHRPTAGTLGCRPPDGVLSITK